MSASWAQRYNDHAHEMFEDSKVLKEFHAAQQAYADALHADPDTFHKARLRFVAARTAKEYIDARNKTRREQRARWREQGARRRFRGAR